VLVKVLVSKTGTVEEAAVVRGPGELPRVAQAGVMGWTYRPYLKDGEPMEIQATILLRFANGVGRRAPMSPQGGVIGMAGMAGMGSAPPIPMQTHGAVRVSAGVVAGLMDHMVAPVYPPIAKAAHVQGVVVLHALLSKTGDIEDLQLISGPPMLTAAAMDAVKQWKYRPYLLNGVPTEVETTINVNFMFEASPKVDAVGASAAAGDGPLWVSSAAMGPYRVERVTPVCSPPADAHLPGMVVLDVIISTEGAVKDVRVLSGAKSLEDCSMAAVRQWRYKPYLVDGVPREVETTVVLDLSFAGAK
jgi:TonB family protein